MDGEKIETKRFHGLRKVKRNDVLVFNFPYSDWNVLKMDPNMTPDSKGFFHKTVEVYSNTKDSPIQLSVKGIAE